MKRWRYEIGFSLGILLVLGASISYAVYRNEGTKSHQATLTIVGAPDPVYIWATQRCDQSDIPDEPAHAYRLADGQVVLSASNSDNNNRSIGASLNTVVHQCAKTYTSHVDPVFDHFQYQEWLNGPYTTDGTTVYTLDHNEWYASAINKSCAVRGLGAWVNAITLAVSHDGGASFTQPKNYIVLRPATEWSNNFPCGAKTNPGRTVYGDFGSSNIISKDGYFWSYFVYRPAPEEAGKVRTCLMRSDNLSDASSWAVWNGTGYTQSQTATDCAAIKNISGPPSVAYSTYLHKYVAVFTEPGVTYFSTSPDLFTWTVPRRIEGDVPQLGKTPSGVSLPYASLLDPTDTSMNFENVGQTPYLYFTVDHAGFGGYNRDLYRVQVEFTQ